MSFDIKELPYAQFEKLGLNKKDVMSMDPEDITNLLKGRRTSLLTFSIELTPGQKYETDAKLSLYRNPDNSLSLNIHPVRSQIRNDIGATEEELEHLKKGGLLIKSHTALNGEKEPHFFQLDKETNEIIRARVRDFVPPNAIKDVILSSDQKEQLRQGRTLELESKGSGETMHVRVDLNEPRGYATNPDSSLAVKDSREQATSTEMKQSGPKR